MLVLRRASPVHAYQGEGIYLLDNGVGGDLYRVTDVLTGLCVSKDNPLYSHKVVVDRDGFNEEVLGIVVADIKPRDERFPQGGGPMTAISRRRLLGGIAATSLPVVLPEAAAGMDDVAIAGCSSTLARQLWSATTTSQRAKSRITSLRR
jgi:hypothetical protein